ncbi:cupin domain-containing protein [Dongia sp.]|uniref:cupin domain-containing protein n=1 Tax=Dongia sp. TaxID=1977262 RepID=UPI0035B289F2
MRAIWLAGFAMLLLAMPAVAQDVVVTPVLNTDVTSSGQKIELPQKDPALVVSTYDIPAGAALPVHEHPFPRYAYVLEGTIRVDNTEIGKSQTFTKGEFIVEAVSQWHKGTNVGDGPVKLLVIDMIEKGEKNVVLQP